MLWGEPSQALTQPQPFQGLWTSGAGRELLSGVGVVSAVEISLIPAEGQRMPRTAGGPWSQAHPHLVHRRQAQL